MTLKASAPAILATVFIWCIFTTFSYGAQREVPPKIQGKLAICLTLTNNMNVLAWLDYHKSIGVSHVVVIADNTPNIQLPHSSNHIQSGFVLDYTIVDMTKTDNYWSYNYCLEGYKGMFQYMVFLTEDEYLVVKDTASYHLVDILNGYDRYAGIILNTYNVQPVADNQREEAALSCVKSGLQEIIVQSKAISLPITSNFFIFQKAPYHTNNLARTLSGPYQKAKDILGYAFVVNMKNDILSILRYHPDYGNTLHDLPEQQRRSSSSTNSVFVRGMIECNKEVKI